MNLDEIKDCIPHREPFLWLDEITEITEQHLVATKYLSPDLPVFQGHYPGLPVFRECFSVRPVFRPPPY